MPDKRLIDANAKLEECQYWLYRNSLALEQGIITREHAKHEENAIKAVCGVLSHAPTIDAVPVVHAYWMDGIFCSRCRAAKARPWAEYLEQGANTFCHVCGAKMDGGAEG